MSNKYDGMKKIYSDNKKFYAENSVATQCILLSIAQGTSYLDLDVWRPWPSEYVLPEEASLRLNDDEARSLMNALWVAGVRPSKDLLDPVNHAHLEGEISWMRSLVDTLVN